jgi:hypothetical protein
MLPAAPAIQISWRSQRERPQTTPKMKLTSAIVCTSMFFRMFDIRLNENSSELFHMEQNYEDKLL